MYCRSHSLLDGPNGPLHLSDVIIRGGDVEGNWRHCFSDAFKRAISVYVCNFEASVGVAVDGRSGLLL
jgi:hypothetical protein